MLFGEAQETWRSLRYVGVTILGMQLSDQQIKSIFFIICNYPFQIAVKALAISFSSYQELIRCKLHNILVYLTLLRLNYKDLAFFYKRNSFGKFITFSRLKRIINLFSLIVPLTLSFFPSCCLFRQF